MPEMTDDPKPAAPSPERQDDPQHEAEPENLSAKLSRLNKVTEQLGEAMRQKPKKA